MATIFGEAAAEVMAEGKENPEDKKADANREAEEEEGTLEIIKISCEFHKGRFIECRGEGRPPLSIDINGCRFGSPVFPCLILFFLISQFYSLYLK